MFKLTLAAIVFFIPCLAQAAVDAEKPTDDRIRIGIYNGGQRVINEFDAETLYQPLTSIIDGVLKKKTLMHSVKDNDAALADIKKDKYLFFFSRYPDLSAKAIQRNYSLVIADKEKITIDFFVNSASPINKESLKGKIFSIPVGSFSEKVGMADLREKNILPPKSQIKKANEDSVGFAVQNKFADVGVLSSDRAAKITGVKVLFKTRPLPSWSLVAAPSVSKEDVAKIQQALIDFSHTDKGLEIFKKLEVKSVGKGNTGDYLDVLEWIEQKK